MSGHGEAVENLNLTSLNRQTIANFGKEVQQVLEDNPGANISDVFEKYLRKYNQRRTRRQDAVIRSQKRGHLPENQNELQAPMLKKVRAEAHAEVIHPFHQTVQDFLDDTKLPLQESDMPLVIQQIELALSRGEQLHTLHPLKVIRIHPDIVVKTVTGRDHTEILAMDHVQRYSQNIPIPRLLGALSYDGVTHIFMSFIKGRTLNELWPSLPQEQKSSIRHQMTTIMAELRNLPLPTDFLGFGSPPICTDVRMRKHQSDPMIDSEEKFNSFLLSTPRKRISPTYLKFLQEKCLKKDHRIVMTHGDLAPRNLIVDTTGESIRITGLVDWECSGAYPEYWEYVKALNTFSSVEDDDWCQFLPETAIGQYTEEWAKYLVVDRAII